MENKDKEKQIKEYKKNENALNALKKTNALIISGEYKHGKFIKICKEYGLSYDFLTGAVNTGVFSRVDTGQYKSNVAVPELAHVIKILDEVQTRRAKWYQDKKRDANKEPEARRRESVTVEQPKYSSNGQPHKERSFKQSSIDNVTNALKQINALVLSGAYSPSDFAHIQVRNHVTLGVMKAAIEIGIFERVDRGRYISHIKVIDPLHARKTLEALYDHLDQKKADRAKEEAGEEQRKSKKHNNHFQVEPIKQEPVVKPKKEQPAEHITRNKTIVEARKPRTFSLLFGH